MVKPPDPIQMLNAGMQASKLRQSVLANNVANLETPGYRRADVRFDDLLNNALQNGGKIDPKEMQNAMFRPMDAPADSTGNDVNMDAEIGEMIKNDSAYKTYAKLTAKIYRQMEMAMQVE